MTQPTAPGEPTGLLLGADVRRRLWQRLIELIEEYAERGDALRVDPHVKPSEVRAYLASFDFEHPLEALEALDAVARGLQRYHVHARHPGHFGLFDPAPATMGIAAETLVAAANPCLATWDSSPFGVELERHLVRAFSRRFGYDPAQADGVFTTGGSEANHTALLLALARRFPVWHSQGVRALPGTPTIYTSTEAHPSLLKASRMAGLGTEALRQVPVAGDLRLDVGALEQRLAEDQRAGRLPLMLVATAGTTSAGTVDPLDVCADVAAEHDLWLHVDAAWGGAAVLVPELHALFAGMPRADSITFDPHKWLSVPMTAGLVLTRHPGLLQQVFDVRAGAGFLTEPEQDEIDQPCLRSAQWSRRLVGLKLFLSLAVAGWDGYRQLLRQQIGLGDSLRQRLTVSGWSIVNDTPLPVVCFVDGAQQGEAGDAHVRALVDGVNASGRARIHATRIGGARLAARACVTNHLTTAEDVDTLVAIVNETRDRLTDADITTLAGAGPRSSPSCS